MWFDTNLRRLIGQVTILYGFKLDTSEMVDLCMKKAFRETVRLDYDHNWGIYRDDCKDWYIGFIVHHVPVKTNASISLEPINPYMFDKLVHGIMPHVALGIKATDYKYYVLTSPTEYTFSAVESNDISYLHNN